MNQGWIPYHIDFNSSPLRCKWLYVGKKAFTEPFFHETTAQCRIFEENRNPIYTSLEELIDNASRFDSLVPTAFIFHISRCGSTLLTQSLSLAEQNIVVSEPPILDDVLRNLKFKTANIPDELQNESVRAVIKLLGKKRFGTEQNFWIKLDSWHIFYYQKLRELYPKTPFIFSYRRPDEVIRSQVKDSGMHAAPGVIQPELFGFDLDKIISLERAVYVAKVLERYFEEYLKIAQNDPNTLFINYKNGVLKNLHLIENFLKIDFSEEDKLRMEERSKFHSKNPSHIFSEEPLTTNPLEYQQKAFDYYQFLDSIIKP